MDQEHLLQQFDRALSEASAIEQRVKKSFVDFKDAFAKQLGATGDVLVRFSPTDDLEALAKNTGTVSAVRFEGGRYRLFIVVRMHEPACEPEKGVTYYAVAEIGIVLGDSNKTDTFFVGEKTFEKKVPGTDGLKPALDHLEAMLDRSIDAEDFASRLWGGGRPAKFSKRIDQYPEPRKPLEIEAIPRQRRSEAMEGF